MALSSPHYHQGHHGRPLQFTSKDWHRARKYGIVIGGIAIAIVVVIALFFIMALFVAGAIGCSIYGLYKYVYLPYQAGTSLQDTFQQLDGLMEQRWTSSDTAVIDRTDVPWDVLQLCHGLPFIVRRFASSIYPYLPVSAQQWAQHAGALRGNVNECLRSDARIVAEHGVNVTAACPFNWTCKKHKHSKKAKTVNVTFTVVNEQGVATDAIVKAKVKISASGHMELSKMKYINTRTDTKFKLVLKEATKTI